MVHIIGRWDKNNPKDKALAHRRIMELFRQYQQTKATSNIEEIQHIVEQMDMAFVLMYKDEDKIKETPHFFLPKRLQDLSRKDILKLLNW